MNNGHRHCPIHCRHGCREEGPIARPSTMRIFCKADESYCLSVRNGMVVLAPANPRDEYQHWIQDMKYGTTVKDISNGSPSFALVNQATGQAIQHSIGRTHPVRLVPYNPYDYLDWSLLWTLSNDTGEGFRAIRMPKDTSLYLDAFCGNTEVHDGTTVGLWQWLNGVNQRWKVEAWEGYRGWEGGALTRCPTVRIFTMEGKNYSLAVRNGSVVLATANRCDEHQHWIKDMTYSTIVKDSVGRLSFSLINKATGQAIKHPVGPTQAVRLVPYNPQYLDESVLWTEDKDLGGGFRAIRMASNTSLNLDAFHGENGQHVRDGSIVGVWEWNSGENQRWKMVPYCKFLEIPFKNILSL